MGRSIAEVVMRVKSLTITAILLTRFCRQTQYVIFLGLTLLWGNCQVLGEFYFSFSFLI